MQWAKVKQGKNQYNQQININRRNLKDLQKLYSDKSENPTK